jgi:large subunit ribosomal protein L10
LKGESAKATVAFVADHSKLTVEEITNLRRALKGKGKCVVVKNTLAERAFDGGELEQIKSFLSGPSLLVLGEDDASQAIKTFMEFQGKVKPKLALKGGVLAEDGSPLDAKSIEAIGNLPPKEVILAQIAGALTSTPSQIVQTINQVIGGIGELAIKVAEKQNNG